MPRQQGARDTSLTDFEEMMRAHANRIIQRSRPITQSVAWGIDAGTEMSFEIPIPTSALTNASSRAVAEPEALQPFHAITFLESVYGTTFDKKKLIAEIREETIIRDPDPVNEDEEAIINIEELADTLATRDMNDNGEDAEKYPEKYNQLLDTYKELILKHKRKLNV